jgi:hypothetical protein
MAENKGLQRIGEEKQEDKKRRQKDTAPLSKRPRGSKASKSVRSASLDTLAKGFMKIYKEAMFDFVRVSTHGRVLVVSMLEGTTLYCTLVVQDDTKGFSVSTYVDALNSRKKDLPETIVDIFEEKVDDALERTRIEMETLYRTDIKSTVAYIFTSSSEVELDDQAIAIRADMAFNPPYYKMLQDRGEIVDESIQSMAARLDSGRNEFRLDFFELEGESSDINDIPVRTDFAIDVVAPKPEDVDRLFDGDNSVITTTSGFINLIPEEYELESRRGRKIETEIGFGALIVVNDIETEDMTLAQNLIALASATALYEEYNWVKPLLSKFDDIKALNKLADIDFSKSDTPASVVTTLVNRGATLAVDFHIYGTNIVNATALSTTAGILAARDKDSKAIMKKAQKDAFDTLDNITEGLFYDIAGKEPLFEESYILPVGYHLSDKSERLSLDSIDASYIIRKHPRDYMRLLSLYLDAMMSEYSYDRMIELYDELGINAKITGKKVRAILHPGTIDSIVEAITEAGLSPELDNPYVVDSKPGLGSTRGFFERTGLRRESRFSSRSKRSRTSRRTRSYRDPSYR